MGNKTETKYEEVKYTNNDSVDETNMALDCEEKES